MGRLLSFALLSMLTFEGIAAVEIAKAMVPHGKIDEKMGRDFMVMTKSGTRVNIEFTRNGKFQEASGKNLNQGDELEPGDGLIALSSAAQILKESGINPTGYWLLEKDNDLGWIYEVSGTTISAKSGTILKKPIPSSISENTSEDISRTDRQTP